MIRRIDARISSIEGSWELLAFAITDCPLAPKATHTPAASGARRPAA
ncbi:hypothetical protein [Methylobrevis pamukkalensis]|nr:hypothetical protein [Methylobrevis pamukkalensis]